MPNLLQLNVTANWGSTGRIAEGIGLAAVRRGWNSTIAYGRYLNASASQLIKVGNSLDVYAHYAGTRFFDREGLGSKSATRKFLSYINEIKPDIIHLHNIHDHWLNYPLLFDYLLTVDTPIVWTFHDCWAFTGGCYYFEYPRCEKWKSDCRECPVRRLRIDLSRSQFNRRKELFSPLVDRLVIVPVSNWLQDYCKESIFKDCRIKLIHNGIDTNKFKIIGPKNAKPLILGVALLWDYRKGLEDFVELRRLIPESVADILLVGLTNKQIKSLPQGIKGITKTQNIDELVSLYNQASVLVNPTYADNFPTVNLEALACGTPVITYRTGGSPEAVDDTTGIVVEKGDIGALVSAITHVIDNPQLYPSEACRKRAVECFNQETQFARYIDLYESILSENK